jgi:hypothetical protein
MHLDLYIRYTDIGMDYKQVYNLCIDYADNTLRGVLTEGPYMGAERILVKFSEYGILLDNRYGAGYDITYVDGGLLIKFKKETK